MNSYIDYAPSGEKVQLLLQQQYNGTDNPSYHTNMSTGNTTDNNNYKPTSIMQFNDLIKSKRRQVKNACGKVKAL